MTLIRRLTDWFLGRPRTCLQCRFHNPKSLSADGYVACCVLPPIIAWDEAQRVWNVTRPTALGSSPACKEGRR